MKKKTRFDLRAKTAVVTGANGGLGSELCKVLLEKGCQVIGTDIAPDFSGSSLGDGFSYVGLDVTKRDDCVSIARQYTPDLWINNAGILGDSYFTDQDGHDVTRVVQVNLLGVLNGCAGALDSMKVTGGAILNVGSFAAWTPAPGLAVYSATKHAVRAFSVALAAEVARYNVQVSVVCPDGIWTPMLFDTVDRGTSVMSFSSGKLLDPAQVARYGITLVERGQLVGSIPRSRAIVARILGSSGRLVVASNPVLMKLGRASQKKISKAKIGKSENS